MRGQRAARIGVGERLLHNCIVNPLSVFTYYYRNVLKLAPVFLVLALAVFGISLTGVLTGSISASAMSKVQVYRGAAMISPNPNDGRSAVDSNIKGDLARNPNIE